MKIVDFKAFEGKNIYSLKKCIRLNVDLEGYSEIPSNQIHGFNDSLVELLPELRKHRCGIDEDLGFIKRLAEGTYLAHICEHIIIAIQNMIDIDVSYGKAREIKGDLYYIIYQYKYKNTGIETGRIAVDIINSLIQKKSFDLESRLNRLKEIRDEERAEADRLLDQLFQNTPRCLPIVSITGTNGKTTTTRLIGHTLTLAGYKVGMTTTGGIYINNQCIYRGDTTGPRSAKTVLSNEEIDAAVLETARGGIVRDGLAYDSADVAVITNITEDHIGLDEVETIEDLAKVKALVGEAVKETGYVVINGDDPMSIHILNRMKSNIIIFSKNKNNDVMQRNMKDMGFGVYTDNGYVCIQNGEDALPLIKIEEIGITMNGLLQYNIENAMAACAALIGLGIEYSIIEKGLKTFYCNEEQNPGRFNVYDVKGVTAILDYGHNIEGYKAVLKDLQGMKHNRLIGVIGVPGDRLDSNVIEVGKISGDYLEYIFIKEDGDKRGRRNGEIAELLEKGVLMAEHRPKRIEIVLNEEEAFERALDFAEPGDIIVVFFEKREPLVNIIQERIIEDRVKSRVLAKA